MKSRALLISLLVCLARTTVLAAPTYFIVGTYAIPREFGGGWPESMESHVVSFENTTDIAEARKFIGGKKNKGGGPWVKMTVAPGKDGMNRDYLASATPEWDWHPTSSGELFTGAITQEFLPLSPGAINKPEGMAVIQQRGGVWFYSGGTLMAELNPVLTTRFTASVAGDLVLEWDYLGPYYAFTVESRDLGSSSVWKPVPGMAWPIREERWTVSDVSTTGSTQLYRVRAELKKPAPDDPS